MKSLSKSSRWVVGAIVSTLAFGSAAMGQSSLYSNTPMAGGGTPRQSQFWIDPTGENDSDNDAISWAPFVLSDTSTVTRLRWWGDSLPDLGFYVSFYNQDPNTIASQPDIFAAGSQPIARWTITGPQVQNVGGMYLFTVELPTALTFEANTRYFVSVVARQNEWYAPWYWYQGMNTGSTFWWQHGAHMYFNIAGGRAFELWGSPVAPACPADISGPAGVPDGVVNVEDLNAMLSVWGTDVGVGAPEDIANGDGFIDVDDLNALLALWGCM
ncbi:MAG: hypothetical protein KDA16_02190 [Phycisphaerales bacterium]|nr:hypothetical protein [Phycisphaerales bacterium]